MPQASYRVEPERIRAFLATHPDVQPLATNARIGESSFYIPIVYRQDSDDHVVYFQDQPWEDEAVQRLLEWVLALRFFSPYPQAIVHLEGPAPPALVQEMVSLHPIAVAKLAAIIGIILAESDQPEVLVAVARKWMEELFDIRWPDQCTTPEEEAQVDRSVMLLNYLVDKYFWNEGQWKFHPLEYILLLSATFGDMVRLRYGGQWVPGDQPTEHRVRCFGAMDVYPLEAVVEMLQQGSAASLWDRYRLLPLEWAAEQQTDDDAGEPAQ